VGFIRHTLLGLAAPSTDAAPQFTVDSTSVPAEVFGLETYSDPVSRAPRIDRRIAEQCPAVKRAHDLIAGTLGGLPLRLYNPQGQAQASPLLDQPEDSTPRSVTMTRTIADMLYDGVAWWEITDRDWRGYPRTVARIPSWEVTVTGGKVYRGAKELDKANLIRFDSPNAPLLTAGARAIRTALILDAAAARYADGAPPADYFTPSDGADPADDDEIAEILATWNANRKKRSTGYVPAALTYATAGFNPEQLQLADARQHAVLEIARVAGVDPEELGVSTTSRTYSNSFDRRKTFVDMTLGGYRQAMEDRLAMRDVTPTGWYALFDLSAWLRSDDLTRLAYHEKAIALGLETVEEAIAVERGLRTPSAPATPAPTPGQAPLRAVPGGN
jgi:phage portal protein BeeE